MTKLAKNKRPAMITNKAIKAIRVRKDKKMFTIKKGEELLVEEDNKKYKWKVTCVFPFDVQVKNMQNNKVHKEITPLKFIEKREVL